MLAHARGRSRPVRPRHTGERPRAVGGRASAAGCAGRIPHPLRPFVGDTARRGGRDGLSGRAGARSRPAGALGAEPACVGWNRFDYLVEVDTQDAVQRLNPDFRRLRELETRGVIVTARADREGLDFVSRFLAPGTGIDEDPVTGSAHCCLGPCWQRRLGRDRFTARQVSQRGGLVKVTVRGNRVTLSGQAVTVLRGQLLA